MFDGLFNWNGNLKVKSNTPDESWFDKNYADFTPDLWRLSRYNNQLLFVPDELQTNHPRNSLLMNAAFKAICFTAEEDYVLWKKDSGIHSMAVPMVCAWKRDYLNRFKTNGGKLFPSSRLRGELYSLDNPSYRIKKLDDWKQNGVEFIRKRVDLLLPYRIQESGAFSTEQHVQPIKAWMYEGNPEFWEDFVSSTSFRPVSPFKPNQPFLSNRLIKARDGTLQSFKIKMDHYYFFTPMHSTAEESVTAPFINYGQQQEDNQ